MSTLEHIRVAHIITTISKGGATENTLLSAAGCQSMGLYDVTVLAGPPIISEGDLLGEAAELGVDVEIVPTLHKPINPLLDARTLSYLVSRLLDGRYHVVHTHGSKAGVLGRMAAFMAGVPAVIHTIHGLPIYPGMPSHRRSFYLGVERAASRLTHEMLSVTARLRLDALGAGVGFPERFHVVRSGMDLEPFYSAHSKRTDYRERLGLDGGDIAVGTIGRVCAQKGQDFLLEAAREVLEKSPMVRFVFVGSGDMLEELQDRTSELGLESHVRWVGSVEPAEIPGYISALDMLVHVSEREGLARVIPQALASGKPVISYDLDGSPEVITDGVNGRLIAPFDRDGLVGALVQMAGDKLLRQRMGERGPAAVDPWFRTEEMVKGVHESYQRALARSGVVLRERTP